MVEYRREEGMAPTGLETGAFVVDEMTFSTVGELEVRKAMRLQYPLSIVAIKPTCPPAGDARRLLETIAGLVGSLIRETDLVTVSSKAPTLYVLLVDALPSDLTVIIARISEEVHRHRLAAPGGTEDVRVNLGGACFPSTAATWRELVSQADRATPASA
jgi:hypothetical protein